MKTKNNSSGSSDNFEQKDYQNVKSILSKYDYDLFDETKDKVERLIRVKRSSSPNKGERWRILEDTRVIFTIEGSKLSKKERNFLNTVDGFNFLIKQFKLGIKSIS